MSTAKTTETNPGVNFFQFFSLCAVGGYYLLHDPGAACCVRDRKTTAGAAAATAAETGGCPCVLNNS